jgi:hypothetical protein
MTKLIVSFNRYQSNWYIGELYYLFFNFLKTLPNISIEYKDIKDLFLHNKFIIDNPLQLEQILAITLYITKSDFIYKKYNNKNEVGYYLLRNVEIL